MTQKLTISLWAVLGIFSIAVDLAYAQISANGNLDDDIITLIYRQGDGNLSIDSPNQALTTFELRSVEPFFVGPRPPFCNIIFCESNAHKVFHLDPAGFEKFDFGPRALAGLSRDALAQGWTVDGATAGGGRIHSYIEDARPVDLIVLETNIVGDFNSNQVLDGHDLDLLSGEVNLQAWRSKNFDLNGDMQVDEADREYWVRNLAETWFGDSNLDGEFNTADFVQVFEKGEFEDTLVANSTWETGDWSGDQEFDTADFVIAFQDGGFEIGPRARLAENVPEPSALFLLFAGCGCCVVNRSRTKSGFQA